jgi:hypothetical protein
MPDLPFEETEFGKTLIKYFFNGGEVSEAEKDQIRSLMTQQPNTTLVAGLAMFNLREKAHSMSEGVSLMNNERDAQVDHYLLTMAAQQEIGRRAFNFGTSCFNQLWPVLVGCEIIFLNL